MIFTVDGLIDEKTNLSKQVSTNKTYIRLKEDNREHVKQDLQGLLVGDTTAPPLTDEDWITWE